MQGERELQLQDSSESQGRLYSKPVTASAALQESGVSLRAEALNLAAGALAR